MRIHTLHTLAFAAALVMPLGVVRAEIAPAPAAASAQPSARELEIAREAYAYLYPLVIMETTRRQQTARSADGVGEMAAPTDQFNHRQASPPGNFRGVVRPNFDTLYSTAWLDLSKEPVVLSIGPTKGRYYMMPLYDMWTDTFAVPGSQTLPDEGGRFVVTGPGWTGDLPKGVERIAAPTNDVWIIGRVQTNGPADYPFVHDLQKGFTLTPLSRWGKPASAPSVLPLDPTVDMKTAPLTQVTQMSADRFYETALKLMTRDPPHGIDQPVLARLRMIGLIPGEDFAFARLPASTQAALARAKTEGPLRLGLYGLHGGQMRNGWRVMTVSIGSYGADYDQRAAVAMFGLGANRPNDAIYPRADFDSDGQPLTGANAYTVHFKAGQLPPVKAFWSLTAYNGEGFTEPNAIDRYALGDRDKLTMNPDGSLDLYLQTRDPGPDRRANWLPIPAGKVSLNLRLYLPTPAALDGTWPLPAIVRVGAPPAS